LPRIALKKLNLNRPTFQGRQIIAGIQRGDDRKRKMNMKLSNITSGLVLGVTLLLATGASAASKGSLKTATKLECAGVFTAFKRGRRRRYG
jgi:hypothetical protein